MVLLKSDMERQRIYDFGGNLRSFVSCLHVAVH